MLLNEGRHIFLPFFIIGVMTKEFLVVTKKGTRSGTENEKSRTCLIS